MIRFKRCMGIGFLSLIVMTSQSWALFGPSEEEIAKDARSRSMLPIFEGAQSAKGAIESLPNKSGDFIQAQDEADGMKTRFWKSFAAEKYLGEVGPPGREPLCYLSLTAPTNEILGKISSEGLRNIQFTEARRIDKKIKTYSAIEWAKMYFTDRQKYKHEKSSPIEPYINGAYQSRVTIDFVGAGGVRGTIQCEAHSKDEHPLTWGHMMRGFGRYMKFEVDSQNEKHMQPIYSRAKKSHTPADVAGVTGDGEPPRAGGAH